jgi:hypothetical protein
MNASVLFPFGRGRNLACITIRPVTSGLFRSRPLLTLALIFFLLLSVGCQTFVHPDGTVERRVDLETAEIGLRVAVLVYNAYRDSQQPQQSRLGEFLDEVERALDLVNRIRVGLGKEELFVTTSPDGGITVEGTL